MIGKGSKGSAKCGALLTQAQFVPQDLQLLFLFYAFGFLRQSLYAVQAGLEFTVGGRWGRLFPKAQVGPESEDNDSHPSSGSTDVLAQNPKSLHHCETL